MMRVQIFHENGSSYLLPVTQSVVYGPTGEPLSVSYCEGDYTCHCDINHPDWAATIKRLGIKGISEWKPPSGS